VPINPLDSFDIPAAPLNFWGYQEPQDGNVYVGMITSFCSDTSCELSEFNTTFREYIACKLINETIEGNTYRISFFLSIPDCLIYSTTAFGVTLTNNKLIRQDQLPIIFEPVQLRLDSLSFSKAEWLKVEVDWVADFEASYLYIGSTFDDFANDFSIRFFSEGFSRDNYFFVDNISIQEILEDESNNYSVSVANVLTNDGDGINEKLLIEIPPNSYSLLIYNRWGECIHSCTNCNWMPSPELSGVYFYHLEIDNRITKSGSVLLIH
jgi:hypothetical protein